jgi:hypothetical protein
MNLNARVGADCANNVRRLYIKKPMIFTTIGRTKMDLLSLVQELSLSYQHYAFNISHIDDKTTVTLIDYRRLKNRQVRRFSDSNTRVIINKLMNYFS